MDKNEIRKKILEQRLALSAEKVTEHSHVIQEHLIKSPYWPQKGRLGIYSSIKNEVLTHRIFQRALEQGLHVYLPRVEQGLVYYEVNGPEDLQRGAWAIPEPQRHCPILAQDEKLDLVVVPGIVFDKTGARLGYGRGFYDRVLDLVGDTYVGLAYDFQVQDELPTDPWDKKMAAVVTEKRLLKSAS